MPSHNGGNARYTVAKDKDGDLGVYKEGDKYFCKECHVELPLKQPCPICKKEIDWDRVFMEIRH